MPTVSSTDILVPNIQERAHAWAQPPVLAFPLSGPDLPNTASEIESPSDSSAESRDTDTNAGDPTPAPRGNHLAWTISPHSAQLSGIPEPSQISLSFSSLSFSHCSRSKTTSNPSPSASTPPSVSASPNLKPRGRSKSISSLLLLRTPAPCPASVDCESSNNNACLKGNNSGNRTRANTIATAFHPVRRSAFTTPSAAFFTPISHPSWDPLPPTGPASHLPHPHMHVHAHAHGHAACTPVSASPNKSTTLMPIISNPNTISNEDARLLDPSYLSSIPLPSHNRQYRYSSGIKSKTNVRGAYTHAMPYIDSQGTLHDPDYRPFPLIRYTKPIPSPFAIRKPYWESDDDDLPVELGDYEDDEDDNIGDTPNTPRSTTPFICYFLETHKLKRGSPSRNTGPSSRLFGSSENGYDCNSRGDRGKWGKGPSQGQSNAGTRSQLKPYTIYTYATIIPGFGNRAPVHTHPQTTSTPSTGALPVNQYVATLSTSSSVTDDVAAGKEKRGWGGILRRTGKKEEGGKE